MTQVGRRSRSLKTEAEICSYAAASQGTARVVAASTSQE